VLCTARARPLWAVATSRRPDKYINMNEAKFTYVHACMIKDFCGTHLLHAQVFTHKLTNSKIYCHLCTTTATTTLNIATDNKTSLYGISVIRFLCVSFRIQVKVEWLCFIHNYELDQILDLKQESSHNM
jgi:hypothetical protein